MDWAVQFYHKQDAKEPSQKKGLQAICKAMEAECWQDTKVNVKLRKSTLSHRLQGVKSQAKTNADRGWLTDEESNAIITYAICLADQGWPLNAKRMKEHAVEILQARIGEGFPGLVKCWMTRFMEKHSERRKMRRLVEASSQAQKV